MSSIIIWFKLVICLLAVMLLVMMATNDNNMVMAVEQCLCTVEKDGEYCGTELNSFNKENSCQKNMYFCGPTNRNKDAIVLVECQPGQECDIKTLCKFSLALASSLYHLFIHYFLLSHVYCLRLWGEASVPRTKGACVHALCKWQHNRESEREWVWLAVIVGLFALLLRISFSLWTWKKSKNSLWRILQQNFGASFFSFHIGPE